MAFSTFKTVLSDISTTPNGDYDPARVIGYTMAAIGGLVFFGCTVYLVVIKQEFDPAQYALGLAGVSAAIAAAAAGVAIKKSDEIPYTPTDPVTPSSKQ